MPTDLPLTLLIDNRCNELGLCRRELVVRLGYKNLAKGLRRLQHLRQGNLDDAPDILANLPEVLCIAPETILEAVQATREKLVERERQAQEAVDRKWRAIFQPHAIVLTERTVPSQITICGMVGGDRLLHIDLDTTKPRATYIRQALNKLVTTDGEVPFFGKVTGIVVNLTPDLAVEYDLEGRALGIVRGAVRRGKVEVTIGGMRRRRGSN